MNTNAFIREIFLDYGAGKISIDLKADIDQFLTRYNRTERLALKMYSYGFFPGEISYFLAEIPPEPIAEFIISALNALSEYLEINDSHLFKTIPQTKHGQAHSFLTYYSANLDLYLEEIIHAYRQGSRTSVPA